MCVSTSIVCHPRRQTTYIPHPRRLAACIPHPHRLAACITTFAAIAGTRSAPPARGGLLSSGLHPPLPARPSHKNMSKESRSASVDRPCLAAAAHSAGVFPAVPHATENKSPAHESVFYTEFPSCCLQAGYGVVRTHTETAMPPNVLILKCWQCMAKVDNKRLRVYTKYRSNLGHSCPTFPSS